MGQIVFQATLGGQVAVAGPNTASSFTLTLPAATDTLVGKATTDTLTNKTLTSPTITGATLTTSAFNGTVGATTASTGAFTTINASTSITNAGLTSGRVTYAGASGLLTDSANLTFNGSKLDVTGDIVIPNYTNAYQIKDTGGTGRYIMYYSGSVSPSSGNDLFIGNTLNNAVAFFSNNTERMRITSAGNVGINTSSPATKLDVVGGGTFTGSAATATNGIALGGTTTNWNRVYISNTGGDAYIGVDNSTGGGIGSLPYAAVFGTTTGTTALQLVTAGTAKLTILTGGNVGIGTSSPVNALQVAGAVAATGGAGGYAANMALLDVSGGNAQITAIGSNTSTVGTLVFQAFSSNASLGGERMRIDSSGNIGIGTSSPTAKLDVNGNIVMTGVAWTAYTPTITAATGSFTTVSATGKYYIFGKTCTLNMIVDITTAGTATGVMYATLPFTSAGRIQIGGYGMEVNATGSMLKGYIPASSTQLQVTTYANATTIGSGFSNILTVVYEIA